MISSFSQATRFALVLGLLIAGGLVLYELVGVIEVLALALLMAMILSPAVNLLVRFRFPRILALLVVLAGVILGFGLLGYIVLPLLSEQGSEFLARLPGVVRSVEGYIMNLAEKYPALEGTGGGIASLNLTDAIQEVIRRAGELYSLTTRGAGLLLQAVGAVVMALYMVSNPRPLVNGVVALFPPGRRGRVEEILVLIRERVSGWIIGQIAAMCLMFVLTWIGLASLGVEYAFTFAVLTGALQIVPFFGPILSAVPPTLAAFADSPTKALVVVVVYVAIHQIEAHIVSPMVMARSVHLHPVIVILAVLAMGDLLGLAGVILAVPTAAVLTVLLDELYVKPLGAAPFPRAAELPDRQGERQGNREGERQGEEPTTASRS
ncbi:MAG TPA: AI-2E family transporter [Rubrobacteraceae bacterium]|nr:AI-2E family transporter [Rubrobacteraceae bacterium]HLL56459.1 AI-2E family transporter [Rubrobacteraceae bacterium]